MASLETQYWNFLEQNPGSTLTFEEWKTKLGNELKETIDKLQEDNYSPYCPICSGCGEDGCCKATMCQMSPDGSYCETYLKDLKIGYMMDEWVMENLYEQFTDEMKEAYDKQYDKILDKLWQQK